MIQKICLNDKSLNKEWKQIAVNCSQLKSLKCYLNIDPNSGPINDSLLSSLKQFKSLKRLNINFKYNNYNEIKDYIEMFSFKAFKGFEQLNHLSIVWPFDRINETKK